MIWIVIGIGWLFLLGLVLHDAEHYEGRNKNGANHNQDGVSTTIAAPRDEHAAQEDHRAAERDFWTHERIHNKWVTLLSAVAAAAAIFAALIAGDAYFETKRQADAADASNKIVQRPYVTVTELTINPEHSVTQPDNFFGWSFQPVVENSGPTPTKDLRLITEIAIFTNQQAIDPVGRRLLRHGIELPVEPGDPDDLFATENPIRALIGPRSKTTIQTTPNMSLPIPNGNLGWIAQGASSAYVLGSIRYFYFDRFHSTFSRRVMALPTNKRLSKGDLSGADRGLYLGCAQSVSPTIGREANSSEPKKQHGPC